MKAIKKLIWLLVLTIVASGFILGCEDLSTTTMVATTSLSATDTNTASTTAYTTQTGITTQSTVETITGWTDTTTTSITTTLPTTSLTTTSSAQVTTLSTTAVTITTTVTTTLVPTTTTTATTLPMTTTTTASPYPEPLVYFPGGINHHTIGLTPSLAVFVDLGGAPLMAIRINDNLLSGSDYTLEGTSLSIHQAYVDLVPLGLANELKVTTSGGQAIVYFIVNDIPQIADKTDFIKYPGEAIHNENFRWLITNQIGSLTYEITTTPSEHTLIDHGDGTFDFLPAFVFTGDVTISVSVTDEYGATAQRDINLNYKVVNPYIYDAQGEKTVDKKTAATDLVMTADTYGSEPANLYYEMTDILLGDTSIGSDNYIFKTDANPRYFSLKLAYLMQLPVGEHHFTLTTTAGAATFIVNITDTRTIVAVPNAIQFTIDVSTEDIPIALTLYANVIGASSFALGETTLTEDHCTYLDGLLTLKASYLDTLSPGIHDLMANGMKIVTVTILTPQTPEVGEIPVPVIFAKATSGDLEIPIALFGFASETEIFRFQVKLTATDYTITDAALTLKADYLGTLPYGVHEYFIINSQGATSFFVAVTDKPQATTTDQNVTKFTYETIPAEALRVQAATTFNLTGFALTEVAFYDYLETPSGTAQLATIAEGELSASGAFGSLTLNPLTKTFAFLRNPGWFGVVVFTYTATDELGLVSDAITMDVVYKEMPPAIADNNTKHHMQGDAIDIVYTITNMAGNSLFPIYRIIHDDHALLLGTDYTVGPQEGSYLYFTIKSAYLETLPLGIADFMLYTEGGRDAFSLTVYSRLLVADPTEEFDKNAPADVLFTITGSPLVLTSLKHGTVTVAAENYTFADGLLTLKSAYLSSLPYGVQNFTIDNGYGSTPISVTIGDSRLPALIFATITYYQGTEADVEVSFTLYDKTVTGLLLNDDPVAGGNYSLFGGILVLSGSYLETVSGSETTLAFTLVCSTGTVPFTIIIEPETITPTLEQTSADFRIDLMADVTFTINLYDNTFTALKHDGITLVRNVDYTLNETTGALALKGSLLVRLYDFDRTSYEFKLHTAEAPAAAFSVTYTHANNLVINGGFETGDLFGWMPYALWKDEPVLVAFRNERVVSTLSYGSASTDPYNRDGAYHYGLYTYPYDNSNKDLNQERMGMLRSSNFRLAGSGVISFKLGGGKNTGTAYVSIRDATTHEELARFGNRHFGNTSLSGTSNAEGYLFQYYFDLSAQLGKELYILIVDAASHEWSVLAFDSFITYYAVAPSFNADQTAHNIVPVIYSAGSATNAIINGALTSNLNNWENPQGVFQIANGGAISSVGGDPALGVLRSPAFTINGANVYLTFDFAGAIQRDKQVFVLVKEVGTNLEVLRLTRRADQASTEDSGDFKTHWYDLFGLDPTKEYYLEVVDNRNGSWGVALIRNVSLTATPGLDYRLAVNAFYGLMTHDPEDGRHWLPATLAQPALAQPDFVFATLGEDSATEINLNYHSAYQTTYLEYTLATDPDFTNAQVITVTGSLYEATITATGNVVYGFLPRYVHKVALDGLLPGTDYIYRIREGFAYSEVRSIKTAPVSGGFSFLYYTDTQADYWYQSQITASLLEQAYLLEDDYLFALLTGDLVETGSSETHWDWFAGVAPALPLMTVPGNHDYQNQAAEIVSAGYYNSMFLNPQNGSTSYLNSSYFFIVDNVLFVMLDVVTGNDLALQQAWFADIVAANRQDFLVVSTHYSMYGTYHESAAAAMIADWLDVFDAADVDLVLSGHDHIYARTPAMYQDEPATLPNTGTYYLIGGTAGHKFREVGEGEDGNFAFYLEETISTISIITVSDTAISIQTIDLEGNTVDTFQIPVKA